MKILVVTRYIYDVDNISGTGSSGLAVIVNDLVEEMGQVQHVFILTQEKIYKAFKGSNVEIVSEKYYSKAGFISVMEKIKPAIVHFHYIDEHTIKMMEYCSQQRLSFLLTFHLYVGNNYISEREQKTSDMEKHVLSIPGLYATVVSSGIKKRIIEEHPEMKHRVDVILNAVKWNKNDRNSTNNRKGVTALCVGTICERKNQMLLPDVVSQMSTERLNHFKLVFVGRDRLDGALLKKIKELKLEEHCEYAGSVSREKMSEYYTQADMLICTSVLEGFSLSVLEAMSFELPIILPAKLDFLDDVVDKESIYICEEVTAEILIKQVYRCMDDIKEGKKFCHSHGVSLNEISNCYQSEYKKVINKARI